jgi:DNA polymerase sigma
MHSLYTTHCTHYTHYTLHLILTIHYTLYAFATSQVVAIATATVPVLKATDVPTGVQCDITCDNLLGVRNTQLLRVYAQIDPLGRRLGELVWSVGGWCGV